MHALQAVGSEHPPVHFRGAVPERSQAVGEGHEGLLLTFQTEQESCRLTRESKGVEVSSVIYTLSWLQENKAKTRKCI